MSAALNMIRDASGRPAREFAVELAWEPVQLVSNEAALPPIGYLSELRIGGVDRKLRQPLKLRFERDGDRFLASASFLSVWGSGKTPEHAVADLEEMLGGLYLEYARTPLTGLDAAAIVQAHKIRRLIDG